MALVPEGGKPKGSTLLTEEPFVYVVKSELRTIRCNTCLKFLTEPKRCSCCQYVYYCTKECQTKGWRFHKHECSKLKKILPKTVPDTVHFLARIIIKLKFLGGTTETKSYGDGLSRNFEDLMSHEEEIKEDRKRMEHFFTLFPVLRDFMRDPTLDFDVVFDLYAKMCINSFSVMDEQMECVASAIYLAASSMNHSCDPNAIVIFDGPTLYVRNIRDIYNYKWQYVTISYTDQVIPPSKRRDQLMSIYYFDCECRRCTTFEEYDLMTSMRCITSNCNEPIIIMDDTTRCVCSECNVLITEDKIQQYRDAMAFTQERIPTFNEYADQPYGLIMILDSCRICLKKQGNLLHPLNIYRVQILDKALETCIILQNWEEAADYAVDLIPGFRQYYGLYHPSTTLLYLKAAKLKLLKFEDEASRDLLEQAKELLLITHGTEHSLNNQLLDIQNQLKC